MNVIHREILRKNRMTLSHSGMNIENVCSRLIRDNIFTNDDKFIIESHSNPVKKVEKLLDLLSHKGSKAFSSFLNVLNDLELSHLSKLISMDIDETKNQSEGRQNEENFVVSDGPISKTNPKEDQAFDVLDGPMSKTKKEDEDNNEEDGRLGNLLNIGAVPKVSALPSKFTLVPPSEDIFNPEECYQMNTNPRGLFILVNNKKFLPCSGMHEYTRNGTDEDAKCMKDLFEELGYKIQNHQDISVYEMRKVFKQASLLNYSEYSALAVCILSHGQEGVVYGTDGTIDIKEITGFFRGKNLAGKPKMFFFQACQGSDYMDGVESDAGRMETDGPPEYGNEISLPTEADFIYAYSTVPGYYSWRNSAKGSWFIQALVEVFRKYAHKMEVLRMLTRVNRIVATKKSQTGQHSSHNKRQISSIISQLRKDLYLCPPNGPLKTISTN